MIQKIKKILQKNFTKKYWESGMSTTWHNKRKNEAYGDFEIFAQATADKIKNLNFDTVVEIGTGAGTLITLLSEQLENYKQFIGVDINKQQIRENIDVYKNLDNVKFVYMDIAKYIESEELNNIVIVSQNTLDYFRKDELEKLFLLVYKKIEHVSIIVSTTKGALEVEDSIDRKESDFKVYKHNYPVLLKAAGFESVAIDFYNDENNIMVVGIK